MEEIANAIRYMGLQIFWAGLFIAIGLVLHGKKRK